jgi:hypothetical protein
MQIQDVCHDILDFVSAPGYPGAIYAPASASIMSPIFGLPQSGVIVSSRSRTLFTKIASPGSLGALAVLGTSHRRVRVLRTVPAVLFSNDSRGLSRSR